MGLFSKKKNEVDLLNAVERENKLYGNTAGLARIWLTKASGIKSSYQNKFKTKYWDIEVFKAGAAITPDMFEALKLLNEAVKAADGRLHIIDLFRNWSVQGAARKLYEAGKKPFVAKPGGSFHGAGRAVDIKLQLLKFKRTPKHKQLDKLWELAIPLGFKPIIKVPNENAEEAWHFDFPGKDWADAYEKLSYPEIAKCCILDVDEWDPNENEAKVLNMFIQAQLIRLGKYEIGKVDGILGSKTKKVLAFMGLSRLQKKELAKKLCER